MRYLIFILITMILAPGCSAYNFQMRAENDPIFYNNCMAHYQWTPSDEELRSCIKRKHKIAEKRDHNRRMGIMLGGLITPALQGMSRAQSSYRRGTSYYSTDSGYGIETTCY